MIEYLASHPPGLTHWLVLTTVLFSIGLYGLMSRRNAIGVLMAVELMLNSAALNFVIFNHLLWPGGVDGLTMSLFIIAVAAAEVVVGMAIFVAIYRSRQTVDVNKMDSLSG